MTYSDGKKSEAATMSIVSRSVEIGLRAIGMWPGTTYAHLRWLFYIFVTVFFQIFQYKYLITHLDDDISSLMDILSLTLTYSVLFFKLIFFALNARIIDDIIVNMANDWRERNVSEEHAMSRMLQIARRFSNLIIFANVTAVFFYTTGTILTQIKDNQTDTRELLVKMDLPYKIESTSVYMMTFFTQYIHLTSVAAIMGVTDSLLLTLVLHVCGQIDIVKQRLNEITWKNMDDRATTDIVKRFVVQHQKIISFSQNIEAAYWEIALVQFVSNTMVICCLGFLIVISGSIGDAAYESLWYHLKPIRNRDLLFMIVRSQNHLRLTVGKFVDLSLQQFANVVKASASYMSVLHAMY